VGCAAGAAAPSQTDEDEAADRHKEEEEPNRPLFPKHLEVERVRVQDRRLDAPIAVPPELERARADALEAVGAEGIDRRPPEVVAVAAGRRQALGPLLRGDVVI